MSKNTKSEKPLTPAETLSKIMELPRFSVEVSLFVGLTGLGIGTDAEAAMLLPAIQALRSELGRIVANAGENANVAKVGKVGKDGERKVTVGKGTTTVKAGFVASLADAALWIGEGVKRTGASLSVSGIAMAFPDKHPLRIAALEYLKSKQPVEVIHPPMESTPEPSEAPTA